MRSRIVLAVVYALALGVAIGVPFPGGPSTPTAQAATEFFEPFETASSLSRFDFALHHTVGINGPIRSWPGDHNTSCGPPTTTRTIRLPGNRTRHDNKIYTTQMGDLVYWCAPGGDRAKAHFMTSIMTTDYAQIDFAPKGYFSNPRRVCWDQNMTDLGSRKWTQIALVPKGRFQANNNRLDYVRLQLEDGPGSHGTRMSSDVFMLVMGDGKPVSEWNRNKVDPGDWAKFTTADKARRFTTCVTDQLNGTVKVELERERSIQTVTLPGRFPAGDVKVIFSDDNYNPPKDPPDLNVPNPTTWHWDNILISGSPGPPPKVGGSTPPSPIPPVPSNGKYDPINPARLLDTRTVQATVDWKSSGLGLRPAGSVTAVKVRGRGGVPNNSVAAMVNVTVVGATAQGFATVYPCGNLPNASTVNYAPGDTIANGIVSKLDGSGRVCIYTHRAAHLLLDVSGSVPGSSGYAGLTPARLLETRPQYSTVDGASAKLGLRRAGSVTTVQVAGRGGVPANARAAVVNLAVVQARARGYATIYPCGKKPNASTVNYGPGETIANGVVTMLDANGRACIYTHRNAHLLLDVSGTLPGSMQFVGMTPTRLLDSRPGAKTADGAGAGLGTRAARSVTTVQVAGRGGVPGNARTAVVNVTVVGAPDRGYATIYPCGAQPNASTVNYGPGDTIANGVITKLDSRGRACIYTHRNAHLLLDVSGTLPAAATGQSGLRSTAVTAVPTESPAEAYERVTSATMSKVCHIG